MLRHHLPPVTATTSLRFRLPIPDPSELSVNLTRTLIAGAIALGLAACQNQPAQPTADNAKPDAAAADRFVADINAVEEGLSELTAAQWLSLDLHQWRHPVAGGEIEREVPLVALEDHVDASAKFDGVTLKPETRRALDLMKLSTAMPAPKDPPSSAS